MTDADRPPPPARWKRWRSLLYEVVDESMSPVLLPGDRVLVDPREYRRRAPSVGEIVVVSDPEVPRRRLIKVVARWVPESGAELLGVNQAFSRDSRAFGLVPLERLIGSAWYRIHPVERRGPLGRIPGVGAMVERRDGVDSQ